MTITDTELHEKIKIFITKLDRMESRVKEVEAVALKIPKLEATLSKISSRIDTVESRNRDKQGLSLGTPPMRNFVIGLLFMGLLVALWMVIA